MIGVLINPFSGKGNYKEISKIERLANKHNVTFITTNSKYEVLEAVKRFRFKGVKILCFYGGDGTAQHIIDISVKNGFDFIFVPLGGGTMLSLYNNLGWKDKPLNIFKKIIKERQTLVESHVKEYRILKVEDCLKNCVVNVRYGFIFVMGPVDKIIRQYTSEKRSFGNAVKTFTFSWIASLLNFPKKYADILKPFKGKFLVNGRDIGQTQSYGIILSISEQLIFNIKPFRTDRANNEFLALSYDIPAWLISGLLPIFARNWHVSEISEQFNISYIYNKPTSEFIIEEPSIKEYELDAEFFEMLGTKLVVTAGPTINLVKAF